MRELDRPRSSAPGPGALLRNFWIGSRKCLSKISPCPSSRAELLYGVQVSAKKKANRIAVDTLVRHVEVLDWSRAAAEHYAEIRADLKKRGQLIGANDLLIAAHARSLGVALVTNNVKEFRRVKGLSVENWMN